jgi:DNA-binding response OmpR family regulator
MKILGIGDDATERSALKALFDRHSYAVDWVDDGEMGLEMLAAYTYDLLVIDGVELGMDEILLCQQLRSHGSGIYLLALTVADSSTQKAAVLNAGADDCMVKPFDGEELIARIRALQRRQNIFALPRCACGQLWINADRHLAAYGEQVLPLTPKEYTILELLFRHRLRPLSASRLLDLGWNSARVPGEETIRGYIKTLRQKLTQAGAPADLVKTVHGFGYQLNPQYEEAKPSVQMQPSEMVELISALDFTHEELRVALEELLVNQTQLQLQTQALEETQLHLDTLHGRFQTLLRHMAEGYIVCDRLGVIQEANPAAGKLLGRAVQRLLGRSLRLFIPSHERRQFQQQFERAFLAPQSWTVPIALRDGSGWLKLLPLPAQSIQADSVTQRQWLIVPQEQEGRVSA